MSTWMAPDGDRTTRLRALIEGPDLILAPGAYDALSARLVEETGFSVVYMTGFGTAAGRIGRPDVGLLTLTEMADQARRLVDAVRIPVIADGDTGYGNPLNVIRTVKGDRPISVTPCMSNSRSRPCMIKRPWAA